MGRPGGLLGPKARNVSSGFSSGPPLGAILGASWAVLGASGAVLGPSWAVSALSWGPLGPSWGSPAGVLGRLGAILGADAFKTPKANRQKYIFPTGLGRFSHVRAFLGVMLEPCWAVLWASGAVLKPSWERSLFACLETCCGPLGPSRTVFWHYFSPPSTISKNLMWIERPLLSL